MKLIPETFRHHGFDYKLLKRECVIAFYEQSSKGSVCGYEIHKVRIIPPRMCKYKEPDGTYKEVEYLEREKLASDEEFGRFGWSFSKIENAELEFQLQLKKFKEVLKENETRL